MMSTKKSLMRSAAVIGAGTATSRILGFLWHILLARTFGTGPRADAFVVAFRIPNLLRDLVGEGATNTALVPVLTEVKARGSEQEFWRLVGALFNIAALILAAVVVVGVVMAPWIVRLIAPGFLADPERFELSVRLTRLIFPYLFFITLSAHGMGALNTLRHFSTPAFAPALLNVSLIGFILLVCPHLSEPVLGLAWAVLVGGVAQLAVQMPALIRKGFRPVAQLTHPAIRRIGVLLLPRAFGTSVYHVNVFVDTLFASLATVVGEGGVSALYFANRLLQLPLAVFAIAMTQAALPALSTHAALAEIEKLKETFCASLKAIFFILAPASVGFIVLGRPIVEILFLGGEFTQHSARMMHGALVFLSLGLIAFGGIKMTATCFYAMQDTKTPVKVALAALGVNILLSVILVFPMQLSGLALATSLSATMNFVVLYAILRKRLGRLGTRELLDALTRIVGASALMGIITWWLWHALAPLLATSTRLTKCAGLFGMILLSIACYLVACRSLRLKELDPVWQRIWRTCPPSFWRKK